MDEWIEAVCLELGISCDLDTPVILDTAREVAHQVERRATPLTTYLMGYAAAQGKDPATCAEQIQALARGWSTPIGD